MKTFKSEKSEVKSPDAKSKRAAMAKKKNYSIYMGPNSNADLNKKKNNDLVAAEEKITGKVSF